MAFIEFDKNTRKKLEEHFRNNKNNEIEKFLREKKESTFFFKTKTNNLFASFASLNIEIEDLDSKSEGSDKSENLKCLWDKFDDRACAKHIQKVKNQLKKSLSKIDLAYFKRISLAFLDLFKKQKNEKIASTLFEMGFRLDLLKRFSDDFFLGINFEFDLIIGLIHFLTLFAGVFEDFNNLIYDYFENVKKNHINTIKVLDKKGNRLETKLESSLKNFQTSIKEPLEYYNVDSSIHETKGLDEKITSVYEFIKNKKIKNADELVKKFNSFLHKIKI